MEPVGDFERQGTRMIELLSDSELFNRIATAARATALARFCTDLVIPRYEDYYRAVCDRAGTSTASAVSV